MELLYPSLSKVRLFPFSGRSHDKEYQKSGDEEIVYFVPKLSLDESARIAGNYIKNTLEGKLKLDLKEIMKRPGKIMLIDFVLNGSGLASFVGVLLKWAEMSNVSITDIKNKFIIYALTHNESYILTRESFDSSDGNFFEIVSTAVPGKLWMGLGNNSQSDDRLLPLHPYSEWDKEPPDNAMTENAALIAFRIIDWLALNHPEKLNPSIYNSPLNNKGGIAFNALPIRTESVVSPALGPFSRVKAFQGDLNTEWVQIQAVFNAGIRPSVQRISEYTAAAASSGLAGERMDQVRSMLADILRSEEEDERLPFTSADLKNLVSALES